MKRFRERRARHPEPNPVFPSDDGSNRAMHTKTSHDGLATPTATSIGLSKANELTCSNDSANPEKAARLSSSVMLSHDPSSTQSLHGLARWPDLSIHAHQCHSGQC